jgi:hypothetical protein
MQKKIILRLDPWSQLALWLLVILLASDRMRPLSPISTGYAQESGVPPVIAVNLVEIGGTKVDPVSGLPVKQVGPPPTTRIGPANFPFQKVEE